MRTIRTSRKPNKQWYTVALLYPDYMTDWYGKDLYVEWAHAVSAEEAVGIVQKKAVKAQQDLSDESTVDTVSPAEFEPVLVFKGKLTVAADATNFG